ncbi:MAG TPA: glycosyltransferase [Roseomonas sp.]|jgi:glycosyltransferase involved in cell wall biosynthesis
MTEDEVVRAPLLTAQMRRDRKRLAETQAEIAALRARVHQLEGMPAHRAYEKVQRAYRILPPGLRGVVARMRNRVPHATGPASSEARPASRGRAIVIDDHWPRPDRDSGSVDVVNMAQALGHLGFDVVLAAAREHDEVSPARDALTRAGLRCLLPSEAASVEEFLAREGVTLDLCVLCRVYCGGRFLETALRDAVSARIVFNSIDLNFLRLERQAHLEQDEAGLVVARAVREREEEIIRRSDATIVVSKAELDFLAERIPEALAVELPLARRIAPPAAAFAERAGIGFIGGFAHAPNVDAMRYFLAEIWPLVLRDFPEMEMTIVGPDFPGRLLDGVPGRVRALGHLPDIGPWFEGLRLTVAPLRFGAGAKGKVASSLAAGVPCIATPVAAEGMALSEASGVMIAADPAGFAAGLREAYTNEALWSRLSAGGLTYAADTLSLSGWRNRLDAMLRRIGL